MKKPVEVVTVVPYREEFRSAFEQLNRDWIEQYFVLEEPDLEVFRDPGTKILQPGGEIFFVLEGDQVQGTCAVLRHDRENCEIAKMAVAPGARGRGYGDLLMQAAVRFATSTGAHLSSSSRTRYSRRRSVYTRNTDLCECPWPWIVATAGRTSEWNGRCILGSPSGTPKQTNNQQQNNGADERDENRSGYPRSRRAPPHLSKEPASQQGT